MRQLLRVLLVAGAVLSMVRAADAVAPFETCCACVAGERGTSAGNGITVPALFCGEFPDNALPDERCTEAGGYLQCLGIMAGNQEALSCSAQLADIGIDCPAAAGAPAGGTAMLTVLALLLAGSGMLVLRRRAPARSRH